MIRYNAKKRWALVLVIALVMGFLPGGQMWGKAGGVSASVQEMSVSADLQSDYGLSNPTMNGEGVTTWDCVWFGNYWQEDTNGDGVADQMDVKTPVKWRVLAVDGDDAFLMADKNLSCRKYNETVKNVTWETCTMRSWLNGDFLNNAFNVSEQAVIRDTIVANEDDPEYGTEGGNNTTDKVYLLSLSEVKNSDYGFPLMVGGTKTREAVNTAYAEKQGAYTEKSVDYTGNGYWWLRSPGHDSTSVPTVNYNGSIGQYGFDVNYGSVAVRPVLHLDLSSISTWSKAGTVPSIGEPSEIPPPTQTVLPNLSEAPPLTSITPPVLTQTPEPDTTVSPTGFPVPTEPSIPDVTISPVSTGIPTPPVDLTQSPNPFASQTPVSTVSRTTDPSKTPSPDNDLSAITDGLGVSEETAAKIQAAARELNVSQDTILVTEQMIQSQKTDEDIKGSYFTHIQARASQITQKNIKLSWNRVNGADGYEIYGNRCNTRKWIYEYKKMKTIENGNKKSFIDRNCKKGTYYKYIVRAYKIIDGKKVTIAASKTIHVTTTGGKNGNAKSVKVNKKKVSLTAGKKLKLRAWEIKKDKPLRHHREVSYESGDPNVATVSKKGRIKAKKKGKCTIFAYAQSGVFRKIKVTVK